MLFFTFSLIISFSFIYIYAYIFFGIYFIDNNSNINNNNSSAKKRAYYINIISSMLEQKSFGLLKCLVTGNSLILSGMFYVIVNTESKVGRCFTYVVA